MHKLTKGLKKKKKGKKSKRKDEDLFKPEELEAYRKQHQSSTSSPTGDDQEKSAEGSDDWRKFTAGIDSVLKKTQDDLDRIKSTSFFQRVPVPSAVEKKEKPDSSAPNPTETVLLEQKVHEVGIVEVSESETEEEDEDIFDTSYIDAIATGEVKLAYIPESPTETQTGDDPFDTSIAERAILGPAVAKKGKKLVSIGSAVEVLTGRIQAPTCASVKKVTSKRAFIQQRDLLLGSFDEGFKENSSVPVETIPEPRRTLLDTDDAPPDLATTPIDLTKNLLPPAPVTAVIETKNANLKDKQKELIKELESELINNDEDDGFEFEQLATENRLKPTVLNILPTETNFKEEQWDAFPEFDKNKEDKEEEGLKELVNLEDPFDTTFAENILPGKAELKLIEKEILSTEDKDIKTFQVPRATESLLQVIQPKQRDLLGGSYTDLTKLGEQPLEPQKKIDEDYIEYVDPFDTTSVIDKISEPCQTELKYLEEELLADFKQNLQDVSSDDFDPRAEEAINRKQSISDRKSVGFILPLPPHTDSLTVQEGDKKDSKPLTPYYIRENSIPEKSSPPESSNDPFDTSFTKKSPLDTTTYANEEFHADFEQVASAKIQTFDLLTLEQNVSAKVLTPVTEKPFNNLESYVDPFDTSIANNLGPGKAELKLIEKELVHSTTPSVGALQSSTETYSSSNIYKVQPTQLPNLLEQSVDPTPAKPLTPVQVGNINEEEFLEYVDPFDTSIADNISLGKAEIKLLESELL